MGSDSVPPGFDAFARWLASDIKGRESAARAAGAARSGSYDRLLAAASAARNEAVSISAAGQSTPHLEVLWLLAAADKPESDSRRPPELTTTRGFRVTLAYDEGSGSEGASICVLVRCPPNLIDKLQGETAFLWNGGERFELGQFDSEGKAIGTLPSGIEITLSDFALGKVKLEEPPPGDDE
jgi:hypothetical protein